MIWKPKQLGRQKIEERELEADKKRTAGDSAPVEWVKRLFI